MNTNILNLLIAQAQQGGQGSGNFSMMLLMIFSLMFIFYLLILRPQKRQERERQAMIESIEKGDKVVTIGGIYGTVVEIDTNAKIVTLEVTKNIKIDFMRSSISQITKKKKQSQSEST